MSAILQLSKSTSLVTRFEADGYGNITLRPHDLSGTTIPATAGSLTVHRSLMIGQTKPATLAFDPSGSGMISMKTQTTGQPKFNLVDSENKSYSVNFGLTEAKYGKIFDEGGTNELKSVSEISSKLRDASGVAYPTPKLKMDSANLVNLASMSAENYVNLVSVSKWIENTLIPKLRSQFPDLSGNLGEGADGKGPFTWNNNVISN